MHIVLQKEIKITTVERLLRSNNTVYCTLMHGMTKSDKVACLKYMGIACIVSMLDTLQYTRAAQ